MLAERLLVIVTESAVRGANKYMFYILKQKEDPSALVGGLFEDADAV